MRHMYLTVWATILLVLACGTIFLETRPFVGRGATRDVQYQAFVTKANSAGLSTYSQEIMMRDCLSMVGTAYGRAKPEDQRAAAQSHCYAQSVSITATAPTNSLAWFTRAAMEAEQGDISAMNVSLMKSRLSGPNEQWLADIRIKLAQNFNARLSGENLRGNDADLLVLMESRTGAAKIARRYIEQPEFAQHISDLALTLSLDGQKRFAENVRIAARELGVL